MRRLTDDDVVRCQKRGYFDEHLAALYSVAYGEPYILEDKYLFYHDPLSKTIWLTLFELDSWGYKNAEKTNCFQDLANAFEPKKVIVTSPTSLPPKVGAYYCEAVHLDKDYQINLRRFDEKLRGGPYKNLRYRINDAERRGYSLAVGKTMTPAHAQIAAFHLMKRSYALWDYQLYLRLNEYLEKFSSPRLFNVFCADILIGFDVIDVLGDTVTTPLGFYLNYPSLADFLVYQEILHAKKRDFKWLDIGWACNNPGLAEFKEKWKAVSRFDVCMQEYCKKA